MRARIGRIGIALAALVGSIAALAGALSLAGGAAAGDDERLLPDMVTFRLEAGSLAVERGSKRTWLRLDNTVGNRGEGPLQISAAENDGSGECEEGDYIAQQDVFADANANGTFDRGGPDGEPVSQRFGCMRYHPKQGHQHWHVLDFTVYELRAWKRPARTVARVRKQGFCLFDNTRFLTGPGSPSAPFYKPSDCGFGEPDSPPELEGMSIGWSDIYERDLPGQSINVRGVDPGRYCLRSEVDPLGRLAETDESNNARRTAIRIDPREERVRILDRRCPPSSA